MDSIPDEDMCDLETMEALLNEDDDIDYSEMLDSNSEQRNSKDNDKIGLSKEMEDFINAMSDDESEDESRAEEKEKAFENRASVASSRNQEEVPQKESSNSGEPKHDVSCATEIMKEMERMKERMEELQNMLKSQQGVENKVAGQKVPEKEIASGPIKSEPKEDAVASSNFKSKIRLMTDEDEGNLFFSRPQAKPVKSPSVSKQSNDSLSNKKADVIKKQALSLTTKHFMDSSNKKRVGEDSDSDWEDMDGDSRSGLSEEGKNLKRLLKMGERRREAHKPKFDINPRQDLSSPKEVIKKSPRAGGDSYAKSKETSSNDKRSLQCSSSSNDQSRSGTQTSQNPEKVVVEDFSQIRVMNPLISSSVMRMRMEGRKLISVSRIQSKLNTPDLQGDWVTIGAVVSKTNAKASSSGKPYSIWRLSDLHNLEHCVSFFLFGQVHKTHWKLDVGTVIGILNPSMMDAMEKNKSEPAFTVKNPNQVMIMGQSKDLGWCAGFTKKGNKCTHFINRKQGDFCSYHVQAEYKKTSAQRLELHGSVTGIRPKSFEKRIFSKDCAYIYGGSTFVPNSSNSKAKKPVTLSKLQETLKTTRKRVNTFSIQDIKPSAEATVKGERITDNKDDLFMDMISVPSPGSMNLVAHLKKTEKLAKSSPASSGQGSSKAGQRMESISATDLLKQHKQQMRMRQLAKPKASELLLMSIGIDGRANTNGKGSEGPCDPLKQVPVLGKGLSSGQDISLAATGARHTLSLGDMSKLKAIQALRSKGGISKEDPNAVRKSKGEKDIQAIKKRVHQEQDSSESDEAPKRTKSTPSRQEPESKKSKFLGNVDLNSAEVKAILKAKSKHAGALAEKEGEREEAYFEGLEKKEMLEDKMKSVTSIEISVFTCKQCHYTAQSALEQCKKEQHSIIKSKAKKRFFVCKKCKHRTHTINDMFPSSPCAKCGSLCYEKTSMYKEKSGPKLDSEILSLRGDEVKFLNSLENKVFMNTVVD